MLRKRAIKGFFDRMDLGANIELKEITNSGKYLQQKASADIDNTMRRIEAIAAHYLFNMPIRANPEIML